MGYYGLNFNVAYLTGDVFINNLISGASELPAAILVLLSQRLGRKIVTVTSLFVGGVALISSALMVVYLDVKGYCQSCVVSISASHV